MHLVKTTMLHEVLILILYLIGSRFSFGLITPNKIYGDAGMIYLVVFFISLLTIAISLFLISSLKFKIQEEKLEIFYGLIPLIISTLIFFITLNDSHTDIQTTFYKSNSSLLFILYTLSVFYKFRKKIFQNNRE